MSDEQVKEVKKKLLEINQIISELDPVIRAQAFEILAPHYFEERLPKKTTIEKRAEKVKKVEVISTEDEATFFRAFSHEKPFKNVHLIVAWYYSQYGLFPITTKLLSQKANEVGLTIPERPDATMRAAKKDGKNLYHKLGNGYQPTVHGEVYLSENYKVSKGTKALPSELKQ
ncbi:MAG: hypothetical protein IBV53_00105 [Candidatus Atribacteria bacterium]